LYYHLAALPQPNHEKINSRSSEYHLANLWEFCLHSERIAVFRTSLVFCAKSWVVYLSKLLRQQKADKLCQKRLDSSVRRSSLQISAGNDAAEDEGN